MITRDEAIAKFKEILGDQGEWAALSESQFAEQLATFTSWALRQGLYQVERNQQEFWLSTAANKSSILAHVEDLNYLPIRPIPSTGQVTIKNNGPAPVNLPIYQEVESDAQISYAIQSAVASLVPGQTVTVTVAQETRQPIITNVEVEKAFYEILFSAELTEKIKSIRVTLGEGGTVNDVDGSVTLDELFQPVTDNAIEWRLARMFQNVGPNDRVYDEFYSHTDQLGVRFGNGIFGKILPLGAVVGTELTITDGNTFLADNQELRIVGEVLDTDGNPVDLTIRTSTAISGGSPMEDKESIRRNLQYWSIYNNQLVWDNDYIYFLKRIFPQIVWVRVWGEKEAEAQAGAMSLDFINTIFISAYAIDAEDIEADVIAALEQQTAKINRRFQWVDPIPKTFSVAVTGKVNRSRNTGTVEQEILSLLDQNYGANSATRKDVVLIKEIYAMIEATNNFTGVGEFFEVVVTGDHTPVFLEDMVYLDLVTSTATIEHIA